MWFHAIKTLRYARGKPEQRGILLCDSHLLEGVRTWLKERLNARSPT